MEAHEREAAAGQAAVREASRIAQDAVVADNSGDVLTAVGLYKQAVGLLSASAASPRERDLIRAVHDDELVRVMIGSVKVAAAGKILQAQKRDAKARAKDAAKERATAEKAKGGGG